MTQLQITVSVFRLIYAFHLIVEGLMACTFSGGFLCELPFRRYKAFQSPTLFSKFGMTLRTRLPDTFHYLILNEHFDCQTPLKNAKFDLFGNENVSWQI